MLRFNILYTMAFQMDISLTLVEVGGAEGQG